MGLGRQFDADGKGMQGYAQQILGTLEDNDDLVQMNHVRGEWNANGAGTWDGGTVTLYRSFDQGVTWWAMTDGVFTANFSVVIREPRFDTFVKAVLSGAGASTDIDMELNQ